MTKPNNSIFGAKSTYLRKERESVFLVSINEQLLKSWESLFIFWKHFENTLSEQNFRLLEDHLFERYSSEMSNITCMVDELFEHHPLLRHVKLLGI